jgi:hypothetical protein
MVSMRPNTDFGEVEGVVAKGTLFLIILML